MEKISVNPYLTFPGNCREAMTFYQNALDGELEIMEFKGSPIEVPEDHQNKVLHSKLQFGDAMVMASDTMPNQNVNFGDSISISISAHSEEKAEMFYNNLLAGGKVIMPFEEAFWGTKFGMLEDKFGIRWMVDCATEQSEST